MKNLSILISLLTMVLFVPASNADISYIRDWDRDDYNYGSYPVQTCGSPRYDGRRSYGKFHLNRRDEGNRQIIRACRQKVRERLNRHGIGQRDYYSDRRGQRNHMRGDRLGGTKFERRYLVQACAFCMDEFYSKNLDKAKNPNIQQDLNSDRVKACRFAAREAFRFAEYFDGAEGAHDGYVRGYDCGTHRGVVQNDDESDNRDSAAQFQLGSLQVSQFSSEISVKAREYARPLGATAGGPKGRGRATTQFNNATRVGGGKVPAKNAGNPNDYVTYSGTQNGYEISTKTQAGRSIPSAGEIISDLNREINPYGYITNSSEFYGADDYYNDGYRNDRKRYRKRYRGNSYHGFRYSSHYGSHGYYDRKILKKWKRWTHRQASRDAGRRFSRVMRRYNRLDDQTITVQVNDGTRTTPGTTTCTNVPAAQPERPNRGEGRPNRGDQAGRKGEGRKGGKGGNKGGNQANRPQQPATPAPQQNCTTTEPTTEVVTKPVRYSSPAEVFEKAFLMAYRFTAPRAYERQAVVNVTYGYDDGYPVGREAGLDIAYLKGQKFQYDINFSVAAVSEYKTGFGQTFKSSYGSRYDHLKSNPELTSLSFNNVSGNIDDGILSPGERIMADGTIKQIGGKKTTARVTVGGASLGEGGASVTESVVVKPLEIKSFTTKYISTVPDVIRDSESSASISLEMRATDSTGANLFDEITVGIKNILGLQETMPNSTKDILQGAITVPVRVINPRKSGYTSKEEATLKLYANGELVDEKNIGVVRSDSQQTVILEEVYADPLDMIEEGRIELRVVLDVDGEQMQAKEAQVVTINQYVAKLNYFYGLLTGEARYAGQEADSSGQVAKSIIEKMSRDFVAVEQAIVKEQIIALATHRRNGSWDHALNSNPWDITKNNRSIMSDLVRAKPEAELTQSGRQALAELTNNLWTQAIHPAIDGKDKQKKKYRADRCKSIYCAFHGVRKKSIRKEYRRAAIVTLGKLQQIAGVKVSQDVQDRIDNADKNGSTPMCRDIDNRRSRTKCSCGGQVVRRDMCKITKR